MPIVPDDIVAVLKNCPDPEVANRIRQFRATATARQYRWPYAIIQRLRPRPARFLDWGCGNGHFTQFLFSAGFQVDSFAFDAPSPLIAWLQREHPERVRYSEGSEKDPVKLPYADGAFDAVASVGVLEHVRETGGNEIASLREIHRILAASGQFFCFHFPNRYSWIEGVTYFFPSRHHHLYRYTKRDIRALAKAADFEVVCLRRYNVLPRNIFGDLAARGIAPRMLATLVDFADGVLNLVLNPFAQNYGFVLRKLPPP
jgi:SAM-dependent methyltransferase